MSEELRFIRSPPCLTVIMSTMMWAVNEDTVIGSTAMKKKNININTALHVHITLGLINKASDALSQILIPDDLVENNQHFVAVKTTGNGNCLYNATSLSISGNESLASELRYLCAAELYMNSASYANYQAFSSDDDFGMCLSGSAEKSLVERALDISKSACKVLLEAAIRNEAEETCNITPRPKWSNLIHIAALSNVIKRPVCSIYPDNTGFPYRKLFNRQFKPNDELVSDIPIYILWSVDGGLPHGPFNPNHFVCVTRRTVCTSETTASLDKTTASLDKTRKRKGRTLIDYFSVSWKNLKK
ncbi:hypothetical protein AM593_01481, partial [Mytilus galloprovincialis]